MSVQRHGQCLCGKVKISASSANSKVGACHCGMCRRWGGGPLLAVDCGTGVSFEGEQYIRAFRSSDWASRGFCSECGTHLFYRLSQNGQYIMPAGLFEQADDLVFDHQVCIDSKPGYYSFAEQTHNMTCDELFAAFAPPQ
ncbi:GFA family protein [Rheinheimera sp.]|uniref:GFA family protein n=1 Tax=Rheinheimera sp. TaxID=1869214 RepID=UPI0037C77038